MGEHVTAKTDLPIVFIGQHGQPIDDHVIGSPCIRIGFFYDELVYRQLKTDVNYSSHWALVDTGADNVYVKGSLLNKYNCPVAVGFGSISVNQRDRADLRLCCLFIENIKRVMPTTAVERSHHYDGTPFDIILGRAFLEKTKLVWDGAKRSYELQLF